MRQTKYHCAYNHTISHRLATKRPTPATQSHLSAKHAPPQQHPNQSGQQQTDSYTNRFLYFCKINFELQTSKPHTLQSSGCQILRPSIFTPLFAKASANEFISLFPCTNSTWYSAAKQLCSSSLKNRIDHGQSSLLLTQLRATYESDSTINFFSWSLLYKMFRNVWCIIMHSTESATNYQRRQGSRKKPRG